MAAQAGNPVDPSTNPHVISGAFVQQYYHILHEQPEEAFKFYQDSSILGRPDSNGTMVSVTTLGGINEKIMSMDFRNCLTKIDTADPQLSHKDGVLIVVTGSLTSHEGLYRRFTQSFFLAPQESGGYFVLNDVFRFISDRQQDEINQAAAQENESSQNVVSASETCLALPEPTPAGKSLISDHVTVEDTVKEEQVINPAVTGTTVEKNASAKPHVQVAKVEPRKGRVAPPPPIQTDVAKKSYASVVKIMKDGPPAPPDAKPPPPDAKPTPSVAKHKSVPKPVTKAVEDQEKSSAKPTQANESDGNVAENNSSHNEQCYSVYIKRVPFNATIQMVEEEFKKFGAIKPGAIQLVRNLDDRFCFGFIEYESQKSMQSAIEASPVLMGRKEVYVEQKRTPTRVVNGVVVTRGGNGGGGHFQPGRGVYHGDNFSGRGGGYADNASYRGDENFNHRNDGNNINRRNDSETYNQRNDRENYNRGRTDGENYNRGRNDGENHNRGRTDGENHNRGRNDGENYNRGRNDGENYNRGRNDGENYNRGRNDGENYNRGRKDGENYNRGRNDGENYNRRNDRENYNRGRTDFNRRNDGENYNRSRNEGESYSRSRNDGESYIRRNDNENFNHRNNGEDFNRRNEFSGRGRGPPPPGNGYQHNGNGFPSRPFQNGNGRPARVSGPKQSQDAA